MTERKTPGVACILAGTILSLAAAGGAWGQPVPLGPEFQVNAYTTGPQQYPWVSVGPDSRFVVVWVGGSSAYGRGGSSFDIFGRRYASDGTALGGDFQINAYTTSNQASPRVSVGPDGGFVVVWTSNGSSGSDTASYSLQGRRFASSGSAIGSDFQVNLYTDSTQWNPWVSVGPGGEFVVAWRSYGSNYGDADYGSVQARRYASDGAALGGELQVNTTPTGDQSSPSVSVGPGGEFVVVWFESVEYGNSQDGSGAGVFGQRFAPDGSRRGANFQVNSYVTGDQKLPVVGLGPGGEFVVVWQDSAGGFAGQDGSGAGLFGQRFASDGARRGPEFQVNATTAGHQTAAAVSVEPDGKFAVVWQSAVSGGSDSSALSIQGHHYASDGTELGPEFQINAYTTSDQRFPAVSAGGDGGFVVVWDSGGSSGSDTDGFSIQARRLSARLCVDAAAAAGGDGSCWAKPFQKLQDALDAVAAAGASGVEIWVAAGTYKPSSRVVPGNARTATFQLRSGLALYGGFAGNESQRSQRDPKAHKTVLSGDLNGDDGTTGTAENVYHVLTGNGVDETAVLDGFTITAGNANSGEPDNQIGAGLWIVSGSPKIRNCRFEKNSASFGGGMGIDEGSPEVTETLFLENSATQEGGGVFVIGQSSIPSLQNVTFLGNRSVRGGGMSSFPGTSPTVVNAIFSGNTATDLGGAMNNYETEMHLSHVTVSGNSAPIGGGMYDFLENGGFVNVSNSIFWGNNGGSIFQNPGADLATVTNSIVEGGYAGALDQDPLLADPGGPDGIEGTEDDDLRLSSGSPAIDAGANGSLPEDTADLDGDEDRAEELPVDRGGRARRFDVPASADTGVGTAPLADMGAHEFVAPARLYVKTDGSSGPVTGGTWNEAIGLDRALQWGRLARGDVTEVWVAQGTYFPASDPIRGGTRTSTFQLVSGVSVYGGFAGDEASLAERAGLFTQTVLSGELGAAGDPNDNTYHVLNGSGADATAVLDGFTISGATANGPGEDANGGGMYNRGGSPSLRRLRFVGNRASGDGGGLYNREGGAPSLLSVLFQDNRAGDDGGGVYNTQASSPTLVNVAFAGNTAGDDGGGLYSSIGSSPSLRSVSFGGNSAGDSGGGVNNRLNANLQMVNCVLWGNTAVNGPQLANSESSHPSVGYTLLQGGLAGIFNDGTSMVFIEDGIVSGDPRFAGSGDLRLAPGSAAIDAGINDEVPADTADLDGDGDRAEPLPVDLRGQARFVDDPDTADTGDGTPPIVDLGAYEAVPGEFVPASPRALWPLLLVAAGWLLVWRRRQAAER